jgi:hypothetical protein
LYRYAHVLKPAVLSGAKGLAEMVGLLVEHITRGMWRRWKREDLDSVAKAKRLYSQDI